MDIYCGLVGWPSNTLYQISPGSKPGDCVSDREEAQSGVYQVFDSTVGGVLQTLSWWQIGRRIFFTERCEREQRHVIKCHFIVAVEFLEWFNKSPVFCLSVVKLGGEFYKVGVYAVGSGWLFSNFRL